MRFVCSTGTRVGRNGRTLYLAKCLNCRKASVSSTPTANISNWTRIIEAAVLMWSRKWNAATEPESRGYANCWMERQYAPRAGWLGRVPGWTEVHMLFNSIANCLAQKTLEEPPYILNFMWQQRTPNCSHAFYPLLARAAQFDLKFAARPLVSVISKLCLTEDGIAFDDPKRFGSCRVVPLMVVCACLELELTDQATAWWRKQSVRGTRMSARCWQRRSWSVFICSPVRKAAAAQLLTSGRWVGAVSPDYRAVLDEGSNCGGSGARADWVWWIW